MKLTGKAIIISSLIIATALLISTLIFVTYNSCNEHRFSLLEPNKTTYDALKIDHKTGKVWKIKRGAQIEVEIPGK